MLKRATDGCVVSMHAAVVILFRYTKIRPGTTARIRSYVDNLLYPVIVSIVKLQLSGRPLPKLANLMDSCRQGC